jgi:hypothetical protein
LKRPEVLRSRKGKGSEGAMLEPSLYFAVELYECAGIDGTFASVSPIGPDAAVRMVASGAILLAGVPAIPPWGNPSFASHQELSRENRLSRVPSLSLVDLILSRPAPPTQLYDSLSRAVTPPADAAWDEAAPEPTLLGSAGPVVAHDGRSSAEFIDYTSETARWAWRFDGCGLALSKSRSKVSPPFAPIDGFYARLVLTPAEGDGLGKRKRNLSFLHRFGQADLWLKLEPIRDRREEDHSYFLRNRPAQMCAGNVDGGAVHGSEEPRPQLLLRLLGQEPGSGEAKDIGSSKVREWGAGFTTRLASCLDVGDLVAISLSVSLVGPSGPVA